MSKLEMSLQAAMNARIIGSGTLMNELHLTSSVFIGHSMSGMIGCIASIKRPQLFSRLILVGASPRCLKSMNPEFVVPLAKIVFCSDERETLEKVTTPCTIIQTTNDLVVPESVAYYMQKKIKGETTVEIVKADRHLPQLTAHLELVHVLGRVLGFEI
ncbi:hypothetical protein PVK06_013644 [Gossypium arboreum]|uniref:Uncharacterized protein n=1 Tax=Gossypium arboreum TaxID=29729 RepID=A0ABR0PSI4_GOSAR|nr:hypothetical protein PVK06_013644 [Gossypium arboreum]